METIPYALCIHTVYLRSIIPPLPFSRKHMYSLASQGRYIFETYNIEKFTAFSKLCSGLKPLFRISFSCIAFSESIPHKLCAIVYHSLNESSNYFLVLL